MFHKVKSVKTLPNYRLEITFENNEKKYYDVKPLFEKWVIFQDLKNIQGLFENVKVDAGRIWNILE